MAGFKEIDIEGIAVKVPDQGFASEETLAELVKALGVSKRDGGRAGGGKGLGGESAKAGKDVKAFGKTLFKMNPALTALETGFNLLGGALTGATGLVKSLSTVDGSFQSLNAVVDFGVGQITRFTAMVPILGGFLTAAAETSAEITKLKLAFMDLQRDTFQGLAEAGFRLTSGNQGLGKTLETVLAANISLDQFGNIVAANNDGLRIFGGTINNAAEQFASRLGRLTDQGSEIGMGLRMLGLNSTAIAEEFSDFITANRLNRALMTGGEEKLNQELLERVKNERIISELTGKSIKEQRAAQMAAVADSAFQAAISGMGEQGAELTTFVAGLPGPIGDAVKQIVAFGTVTSEESARLIASIPGLREVLEKNILGIQDDSIDSSQAVASTIQLGQRAIEDGNGLFLAKIAMLDPAFQAVADFIMAGQASSIQLANINTVLGKNFTDLGQAQTEFNTQHEKQIKIAEELSKTGKLTAENLKAAGVIDEDTIGILLNAVKVEDAVGSFQAGLFGAVNNLDLLDTAIDTLIGTMNDALRLIDPNFDKTMKAKELYNETGMTANEKTSIFDPGSYTDDYGIQYNKHHGNYNQKRGQDLEALMGPDFQRRPNYAEEIKNLTTTTKKKAFGGSTYGNQLYLVGEHGPELFVPSTNGTILPDQSKTVNTPGVNRIEDKMVQASSTQTSTVSAFQNALTTSKMTTSDPEAIQELMKMNRMLAKMLPKLMTSEGIY